LIEICVEGIDGLLAAQQAGADRVELCASLVEGGITPSFGTVRLALKLATVPFHVIVRPRGGDFLYSDAEFRSMLADVEALRDLGVAGVRLMTNNPDKVTNLEDYGVHVAERVPLTPRPNDHNIAYLLTKRDRMGHALPDLDQPRPSTDLEGTLP